MALSRYRSLFHVPQLALVSSIGYVCIAFVSAQAPSLWINPAGGEISSPANWNGPVASATQDGRFDLNNTYTVTVADNTTVRDLGVAAGNVSISVAAARTLQFNGVFQVEAGATGALLGAGAVNSLRFTNHGNLFLDTVVTLTAGTSTSDGTLAIGHGAFGSVTVGDGVILDASNGIRLADVPGVTAAISQTGGTVRATTGITFGPGEANYNFGGGALEVGSVNGLHRVAGGTGAFNFSGGTIRVIGSDLTSDVNVTLLPTLSSTNVPTIDTNTLNATWTGNLTAPSLHQAGVGGNALIKAGSGTLTLSGASRVLDTFAVTGGVTRQTAGATSSVELAVGTGTGNTGSYVMDDGTLLIKESTLADNTTPVAGSFRVGDFSGTGTFTQNAGTVTVGGSQSPLAGAALNIGNQGGSGTYNLSGGTLILAGGLNVLGRSAGTNPISTGVLNITQTGVPTLLEITNDGSLINGNNSAATNLGTGTINHNGGIVRVSNGTLYVAGFGNGTYNLNGGTLEVGGDDLQARYNNTASTSTFNFGAGTIRVIGSDLTSDVNITLLPTLSSTNVPTIDTNTLNATWTGNLTAPGLHQAGAGGNALIKTGSGTLTLSGASRVLDTFAITGGITRQTAGATSAVELAVGTGTGNTGSFVMDGGTLLIKESTLADNTTPVAGSFRVGDFSGTGTFTQNAGTITVGGSQSPLAGAALNIGNQGGSGIYNLNGGTLTLAGGINVLGRSVGTNPISTGVLNITQTGVPTLLEITNDGSLINGNNSAATNLGTGTINHNGGIVRVSNGTLYVAGFGNGTYNLNGGTLEVGGDDLQARYNNTASTSTFNFGAGEIRVIGSDLISDINANLVDAAGAVIDTNGLSASLTGILSGIGELVKEGGGTLTLTGLNSYSGGTSVLEGTLIANGSNVLGNGSVALGNSTSLSLGGTNIITLGLGTNAGLSLTGATVHLNIVSPTQFDSIVGGGFLSSASFANSTLNFFGSNISVGSFPVFSSFGSYNGSPTITGYDTSTFTASYSEGVVTFVAVPEPRGTLVLAIGLGLTLMRPIRWQRLHSAPIKCCHENLSDSLHT